MASVLSRDYRGPSDLPALIRFAQKLTAARWPAPSYYHAGDFVWQLYASDDSKDARLWTDAAGQVVACAIFEPPLIFEFDFDPGVPDPEALMADIEAWARSRRALAGNRNEIAIAYARLGNDTLSTSAYDQDGLRIAFLTANGYRRDEDTSFRLARLLDDPPPAPDLPPVARFRPMLDGDARARAELHRDAWSVWGTSKYTTELYQRLRHAPLYDPDLDVVLEYEGQLVSYCVCWADHENRIGLFEPVGTRPSAARRGFGRAVLYEALGRLRDKGMRAAIVSTGTVNRPAMALYASAGFDVVLDRQHNYVRRDD